MASYFVRRETKIFGPIPGNKVLNMAKSGQIHATDEIAAGEDGPWKPITVLPSLAAVFEQSNVAPVAPAPVDPIPAPSEDPVALAPVDPVPAPSEDPVALAPVNPAAPPALSPEPLGPASADPLGLGDSPQLTMGPPSMPSLQAPGMGTPGQQPAAAVKQARPPKEGTPFTESVLFKGIILCLFLLILGGSGVFVAKKMIDGFTETREYGKEVGTRAFEKLQRKQEKDEYLNERRLEVILSIKASQNPKDANDWKRAYRAGQRAKTSGGSKNPGTEFGQYGDAYRIGYGGTLRLTYRDLDPAYKEREEEWKAQWERDHPDPSQPGTSSASQNGVAANSAPDTYGGTSSTFQKPSPKGTEKKVTIKAGDVTIRDDKAGISHVKIECNSGLVIDADWKRNAFNDFGYDIYEPTVSQNTNRLAVMTLTRSVIASYLRGEYD